MAKNKSVSKEALDASEYKGDLRGYMNNYEYDDEAGEYVKRAVPLTKRKDDMVLSTPTAREMEKGYARIPTKKKVPIVSMQELVDSKMDLNSFMNAYKHDGKEWKLRDKPKMRQTMVDQIRREESGRHAKGGSVKSKSKSASSRGDGIAQRGKTRA